MQQNFNSLIHAARTYYLYTNDSLIAEATQTLTLNADETITADQNPEITTQYGPNPQKPFTTGTLFLKTKDQHNETVFGYYHHDHLDTPIQITDKSGNILWAARYHAFGKATITTSSITSNLRFPGQYHDDETGMHYNWNRYYDPSTGRYVTQDPIGLRGGVNRYVYVNGSPLFWIDPWGLETCVLVTWRWSQFWSFGTHASLYMSRGDKGKPALYDPSGSYARSIDPYNGDMVTGPDANKIRYAEFYKEFDEDKTKTVCAPTTQEEEEKFYEKALWEGGKAGVVCAQTISSIIAGSDFFPHVKPNTFWPNDLYDDAQPFTPPNSIPPSLTNRNYFF